MRVLDREQGLGERMVRLWNEASGRLSRKIIPPLSLDHRAIAMEHARRSPCISWMPGCAQHSQETSKKP
jgi:hypothetical protein